MDKICSTHFTTFIFLSSIFLLFSKHINLLVKDAHGLQKISTDGNQEWKKQKQKINAIGNRSVGSIVRSLDFRGSSIKLFVCDGKSIITEWQGKTMIQQGCDNEIHNMQNLLLQLLQKQLWCKCNNWLVKSSCVQTWEWDGISWL